MSRFLYTVEEIDALLVDRMAELARHLLPDGEKRGCEWIAKNPGRADRRRGSLSVNLNTGVWKDFSSGQGARNLPGLGLVTNFATAGDFKAAVAWAKGWLGIEGPAAAAPKAKEAEAAAIAARERRDADELRAARFKRDLAFSLFLGAAQLDGEDPASLYLKGRGLELARYPRALRFHAGLQHPHRPGRHAALVAVMTLEGRPSGFGGIHRIYLERSVHGWVKAFGGEDCKLALGYAPGATVRIASGASGKRLSEAPAGEELLLTEGIEDAIALMIALPDARICAAYSLAAIGQARFPACVKKVTIVADNDAGAAVGQLERASDALAARHDVAIAHMPERYKDVNDALIGKQQGA